MCGITGIVDFRINPQVSLIELMNNRVRHRGPDDEGYLLGNVESGDWQVFAGVDTTPELTLPKITAANVEPYQLAFGHRRLSILDTSSAGHGPMGTADGKYWITYNGEVYNYLELREELEILGHDFFTGTDTEVILRAYQEWGVACLKRFNGMWAFALWDVEKKRLFCARDRFGIKPFHYYWDGQTIVLGSEIKSLIAHPKVDVIPDDEIIYDYLVTGSIDHTNQTFFSNVSRLPAAHYLVLDLASRELYLDRYWELQINEDLGGGKNDSSKLEKIYELFETAVRLRMRSDVPIGTTLSGGLDSSSIVWVVNKLMREDYGLSIESISDRQKTFSVYFEDERIDERAYIEQIVAETSVSSNLIRPEGKDGLWKELEKMQWHHDEPLSSTSMYAQWNVMRLAKQGGVKVLLDGQGADEILGGYSYYLGSYLAQTLKQKGVSAFIKQVQLASPTTLTSSVFLSALGIYNALPSNISQIFMGIGNRHFRSNTTIPVKKLQPRFSRQYDSRNWMSKNAARPVLANHMAESLLKHSVPALLRFEDRNSMAFSLESRVPYLDHELVEYVYSLPATYRINNGWTKWALRKQMQGKLPDSVVWRRGKLGFETPHNAWLQEGQRWISKYMKQQKNILSHNYLKPSAMSTLIEGQGLQSSGIWRMINLEVWLRTYF